MSLCIYSYTAPSISGKAGILLIFIAGSYLFLFYLKCRSNFCFSRFYGSLLQTITDLGESNVADFPCNSFLCSESGKGYLNVTVFPGFIILSL